jgi:hypothetical protein
MISLLTAFIFLAYDADWYWWALWFCLLILQTFIGTVRVAIKKI